MPNKRVFYACQGVYLQAPHDAPTLKTMLTGVQSVGINTNFNLEQVFELGQISIYENIEGIPDVEVTMEKVFDGHGLIFPKACVGAAANTLVSRSKERCMVALGIFDDGLDAIANDADNTADFEIQMDGLYVSNISYSFPTDGNFTESVSFVGNSKTINNAKLIRNGNVNGGGTDMSIFDGTHTPPNIAAGKGGIQRRENLNTTLTKLPKELPGVTAAGGLGTAKIQSINISTDFGREDIYELGKRAPYYRAPNFPIEVTIDIEMIALGTDGINAAEEAENLTEQEIKIVTEDGKVFDLNNKNRLSSVTYGGGDASGGQATCTYSYTNFNDLTITG